MDAKDRYELYEQVNNKYRVSDIKKQIGITTKCLDALMATFGGTAEERRLWHDFEIDIFRLKVELRNEEEVAELCLAKDKMGKEIEEAGL